jgi:hypothetical protein
MERKRTTTTSVLRGTNINSGGMWNEENSDLPKLYNFDNYD